MTPDEIDLIDDPGVCVSATKWVRPLELFGRKETTFGETARFG
jgi:hypothetical protein